jgi:hypothetical protein
MKCTSVSWKSHVQTNAYQSQVRMPDCPGSQTSALHLSGGEVKLPLRSKPHLSLFIQRATPAFFGTKYLFFLQIKLAHHEFAIW